MVTKKNIMDAYLFLRKENHDIPSEALDFILEASIEKQVEMSKSKTCNGCLYSEGNASKDDVHPMCLNCNRQAFVEDNYNNQN
jgi:hypothetical protein